MVEAGVSEQDLQAKVSPLVELQARSDPAPDWAESGTNIQIRRNRGEVLMWMAEQHGYSLLVVKVPGHEDYLIAGHAAAWYSASLSCQLEVIEAALCQLSQMEKEKRDAVMAYGRARAWHRLDKVAGNGLMGFVFACEGEEKWREFAYHTASYKRICEVYDLLVEWEGPLS
jgi:hypothetical protein